MHFNNSTKFRSAQTRLSESRKRLISVLNGMYKLMLMNKNLVTRMTLMKAERMKRRWSQTELAFLTQLTAADISRFESGRMTPYPSQAARLSRFLGIEPDKLQDQVETEVERSV